MRDHLLVAFTVLVVGATVHALISTRVVSRVAAPLGTRSWIARIAWHPFAQLCAICGLLLVNQVLCDAYIVRAHHGDPSFVTQYLGRGWFDISRGAPIDDLAARLGDARWLAPTVLRVQAVLELPFT